LVALLVVSALVAAPMLATNFQLFQLTNILIYALALVGLNLLVGYNGQISLGHGAFYAVGAYATALLVVYADVPHWLAIPLAGLVCLVVGFVFSLPLLRLQPMHLAMATFALGAVVPSLAKWKGVEHLTGGTQGLGIDEPPVPMGLAMGFDQWVYALAVVCLTLGFWLTYNLLRGRVGRAAIAIRDHPIAAQSMGIHNVFYKAAIFAVSAMLVGMAGALAALSTRYVAPGMFGLFLSFGFLIGIALGGLGSLSGALYGALCLQGIFLVVGTSAKSLQTVSTPIIYGVVLIVFLSLFPNGIAGLMASAAARLRRARAGPGARAPGPVSGSPNPAPKVPAAR
jgi:branched-chain amino acid transport system permease protein